MTAPVRLGTRRSALATAQSGMVAAALAALLGRPVELVGVETEGDVRSGPLAAMGGTGVFVSALRDALHRGEVDIAVHSLKDLPTAPAEGLVLAAVPEREDPRDVLVTAAGHGLSDLPPGARVGTGSPRRAAALRRARPDLAVVPIRGNVDSRAARVTSGDLDGVVLAAAGLARLGATGVRRVPLDPALMLPAPGQGALAVEARSDLAVRAADLHAALTGLDHAATRAAVAAERAVLAALAAGCSAPVGALAVVDDGALTLTAAVLGDGPPGEVRCVRTGPADAPERLGAQVARFLLDAGASDLIANAL